MDWLFEGQLTVYILLGAALGLALALWWNDQRQRHWLVVAAIALVLLGVYYLLDRVVVTKRENLQQTVQAMTDCVKDHKLDIAFAHISDQFRTPAGRTKDEFRNLAEDEIRTGRVKGVKIWDIQFPNGVQRDRETRVTFLFKLQADLGGKEEMYFLCDALFAWEPPHGWRMRSCRIMDPTKEKEEVTPFF